MDNPRVAGVTITRGAASDIQRLEPLWVAVNHQHMASMPEPGPYVSDAETWRERRALYEERSRLGVNDVITGALPGNAGAIRTRLPTDGALPQPVRTARREHARAGRHRPKRRPVPGRLQF